MAVKGKKENLEKYRKEFHIQTPILLDEKAKVANRFGVWAHPVTFFINREGKAMARVYGGRDWVSSEMRSFIQGLLRGET